MRKISNCEKSWENGLKREGVLIYGEFIVTPKLL
jgi:hypothetical protein